MAAVELLIAVCSAAAALAFRLRGRGARPDSGWVERVVGKVEAGASPAYAVASTLEADPGVRGRVLRGYAPGAADLDPRLGMAFLSRSASRGDPSVSLPAYFAVRSRIDGELARLAKVEEASRFRGVVISVVTAAVLPFMSRLSLLLFAGGAGGPGSYIFTASLGCSAALAALRRNDARSDCALLSALLSVSSFAAFAAGAILGGFALP
ncbi:MAG: hypothetical protein JRN39_05915 [Nitrososphaerota archaeon]|nr:hypothetical protein [Nitrososphaerota archaeon]MDG6939917.1 hypothetical protein [Nitrososphaerota archaeon]